MNYKEFFNTLFVENKKLTDKEILNIYEKFDYKDRLFFTMLCKKNLINNQFSNSSFQYDSFSSFYNDNKARPKRGMKEEIFVEKFSAISNISDLTDKEKESLLDIGGYPIEERGDYYWAYHGYNENAISGIKRPFAIKIGIAAHSFDDSVKIYNRLFPYLIEHEKNICFKMPFKRHIENHLKSKQEGNLITIYTLSNNQAFEILKDFESLLKDIDVEKGTNTGYVEVGDTGLLSCVYDYRPFTTEYIQRETDKFTVGRIMRGDNFERLLKLLKENGFIYGRSIEANEEKQEKLKFGKYASLKEKITKEDIIKIENERSGDKTAFVLGKYNVPLKDLIDVFNKDYGITDDNAFGTLKSYGFDTFVCLNLLSRSKEDNIYSLRKFNLSINFLDDIVKEKNKYFAFLETLYMDNKESFTFFYNFMVNTLIYEIESPSRKSINTDKLKEVLLRHIDFILAKSNDFEFPRNKFFNTFDLLSLQKIDNDLNKRLFDAKVFKEDLGQEEMDMLIFRHVKNDESVEKIEKDIKVFKDLGFSFVYPDTNYFLEKFDKLSEFHREKLLEDILDNKTYYAYLKKENFSEKCEENIEKITDKIKKDNIKIDLTFLIDKYLNCKECDIYYNLFEEMFEKDIADLNQFATKLEYKINNDYSDSEKLFKLYSFLNERNIKINIYNYNFEKVLEEKRKENIAEKSDENLEI